MHFDKGNYTIEELELRGETLKVRAFRSITYVNRPVCQEFQCMNIFAPECYYEGQSING